MVGSIQHARGITRRARPGSVGDRIARRAMGIGSPQHDCGVASGAKRFACRPGALSQKGKYQVLTAGNRARLLPPRPEARPLRCYRVTAHGLPASVIITPLRYADRGAVVRESLETRTQMAATRRSALRPKPHSVSAANVRCRCRAMLSLGRSWAGGMARELQLDRRLAEYRPDPDLFVAGSQISPPGIRSLDRSATR